MESVRKLPLIISMIATIIVGITSFKKDTDQTDLYMKMAITMIAFYLIGVYVRSILEQTKQEMDEKKKLEEAQRIQEEKERLHEEEIKKKEEEEKKNNPSTFDFTIDDDEFEPFSVSEILNTKEK